MQIKKLDDDHIQLDETYRGVRQGEGMYHFIHLPQMYRTLCHQTTVTGDPWPLIEPAPDEGDLEVPLAAFCPMCLAVLGDALPPWPE